MMRSFIERAALLSALTLSIYFSLNFPVQAEPQRYVLDPDKSKLYVQVFKDESTLVAALAHDHVVLATGWQGKVVVDTKNLAACVVEVTVPVSGLRADLHWKI